MATEDEKAESGAEGEGGRAAARPRGSGRNRGERDSAGRGGATSDRELEAALARMDPQRLASLIGVAQARAASSGGTATPKISRTLDKLDAEEANNVIAACEEALDGYNEAERNREPVIDAHILAPVRDASPEVEAAIVTNSSYRRKPVRYSVEVVKRYLESRHGQDAEPDRPAA